MTMLQEHTRMTLSENEINALRMLVREEVELLRAEMHTRFNEVLEQLEKQVTELTKKIS